MPTASSEQRRSRGSSKEQNIRKLAGYLEFSSWLITLFGMLSQVSASYAFPSYNIALGFWGAYCSFSKRGRATFGFISLSFISVILDIVFCSINGADTSEYKFCLTMLIICIFFKLYAMYYGALFFASIGGASSFEEDYHMNESMYDSLVMGSVGSLDNSGGGGGGEGGYYPPDSQMNNSTSSFVEADGDNG